jgi:hypothetical protein
MSTGPHYCQGERRLAACQSSSSRFGTSYCWVRRGRRDNFSAKEFYESAKGSCQRLVVDETNEKGWVNRDPIGNKVVLTQRTWNHIISHHGDLASKFIEVIKTISDPDIIVHNTSSPTRTANYRYCKKIGVGESDEAMYISVPMKIVKNEIINIPGYGRIVPGDRLATSAYPEPESSILSEPVVWRKA